MDNSPETWSFLLLPLVLLIVEELVPLWLALAFTPLVTRPVGDTTPEDLDDDEGDGENDGGGLLVMVGVTTGLTDIESSLATTFGPTVMTVGLSSVNAKVDPGNGSRYGGGLRDLIETCVGMSERRSGVNCRMITR